MLQCICFWNTSFSKKPKDAKQDSSISKQRLCIATSSFLQLPNDCPAHFEQLHVSMTTASTGQQADNDCHPTLNDITTPTTTADSIYWTTGRQCSPLHFE
jgi:hypothetical protein